MAMDAQSAGLLSRSRLEMNENPKFWRELNLKFPFAVQYLGKADSLRCVSSFSAQSNYIT